MAMDNLTKSMAGTAIGLGSIALVGQSMRMIPKNMMQMPKPRRMQVRTRMQGRPVRMFNPRPLRSIKPMKPMKFNARKATGTMIKGYTGIMVGIPMLSAASSMIN